MRENIELEFRAVRNEIAALRREREITTEENEKAVLKAEMATEKRFQSVNEFRAQLADQAGTFMPREVADQSFLAVRNQIADTLPRETFDSTVEAWTIWRNSVEGRLNIAQGEIVGKKDTRSSTREMILVVIAVLALAAGIYGNAHRSAVHPAATPTTQQTP